MIRREFEVNNSVGLHARPAALFVQTTNKFSSDVFVEHEGNRVNGKSIMGLMALAVSSKAKITVEIDGPDEQEAMDIMEDFLQNKIGQF